MKIKLSCDDGCSSDLRVAELCKKYGIDCTFYWPVEWHSLAYSKAYEPLSYNDAKYIINEMGFELGSHTITHRHLTKLSAQDIALEVVNSKEMLEDLFDVQITKFCPPRGYTNKDINDIVYEEYDSQRLTRGKGLVHVHPNSGANDYKNWLECLDDKTEEIWCHSWELNKYNLWGELEGVLSERG